MTLSVFVRTSCDPWDTNRLGNSKYDKHILSETDKSDLLWILNSTKSLNKNLLQKFALFKENELNQITTN